LFISTLISDNSRNTIIYFFLLPNLIKPVVATEFFKLEDDKSNQINKLSWSKDPVILKPKPIRFFKNKEKNDFSENKNQEKDNVADISKELQIAYENKNDELVIQSDSQSEINNTLYAEGNVFVSYKGKFLKADNLVYDKIRKKISANGNISLILGEQIFKISKLDYNFITKKGSLLDVQGSINTSNLIKDLYANFSISDLDRLEDLLEINRKKVLNTPGKVQNWIFYTDEISIDGDKWTTQKAVFTNDLLDLKQVKMRINRLEALAGKDQLKFKSSLNYFILDEKVALPFWFGNRTFSKGEEDFKFRSTWSLGYDKLDKDGYFIGRKLKPINISNDFVLDLEPQFLIQRSFKGHTKSFIKKGNSITSERVKRDTSFEDYFALNSQLNGKIENWELGIEKELNTFDLESFPDAIRIRGNLSKEIDFLNSKWNKSFYGVYRDRVWNGSIGEAEIYEGLGSKLEKRNSWEVNGINKTEVFSLGIANLKGEALSNKDLVSSLKSNFYYSLDQDIPIFGEKLSSKLIDNSFEYIPKPIDKGLKLKTKISFLYSLYEYGNYQSYLGFGAGPEFTHGDLKKKFFDYTKISLLPIYKIKTGESIFKFDQISEKFTLDIDFDQQLYGPLILNSSTRLNLDSDSKDYGEFINSKISLNWKKRSYEFGIFYQPHNEAGGISFNLFGFK